MAQLRRMGMNLEGNNGLHLFGYEKPREINFVGILMLSCVNTIHIFADLSNYNMKLELEETRRQKYRQRKSPLDESPLLVRQKITNRNNSANTP